METDWKIVDNSTIVSIDKRIYIDKILTKGYIIRYRRKPNDPMVDFIIKVFDKDKEIATITFAYETSSIYMHCQNNRVEPEYRRQGIATASYVLAEALLNKIMDGSWDKSPDAEALWAQKNRPFGNINDKTITGVQYNERSCQ